MKLYFYHKLIVAIFTLALLIFILFAIIVYPKLNYFEPLKLSIEAKEPGTVSMYAKTPFNRTIDIPFDTLTKTFNLDYSFLNSIYIILPAHFIINDLKIYLSIGKKDYTFCSDNMQQSWEVFRSTDQYQELLLKKPNNQKSLISSFLSVFHWPLFKPFYLPGAIILLLGIIGILLFYYKDKIRKIYHSKTRKQKIVLLSILTYSIFVIALSVREYILLKKGLEHINIISSICFYSLLFIVLLAISYITFHLFRISSMRRNNLLLSLLTVYIVLVMAEICLRIAGINANYFERINGVYGLSNYDNRNAKYYHLYKFNDTITHTNKEFKYVRYTNETGLCEKHIDIEKNDSIIRMIALGDSFTEGMGVEYDSSWPKLLEKELNINRNKYEVINAGINASDPIYEFILLRDKLLFLKPDKVFVAINNSDISDIIFRGGFERFRPDGSVRYKKAPWWEPFYATSFILRLIMNNGLGYDYHLLSRNEQKFAYSNALNILEDACKGFSALAERHNFQIVFLFHPLMKEAELNHYFVLDSLIVKMKNNNTVVDVLPDFIKAAHNQNITDLFWPLDMHYKVAGHKIITKKIMTLSIEKNIKK